MRKYFLTLMMIAFAAGISAAEMTADEILRKIDRQESYKSNYAEMKQIITTSGGSKRTLEMKGWSVLSGEKQLSEYLAPADIKGQKILMTDDGDNIWMYNDETRRTRKLGSSMKKKKVMGSDFTYEDQNMVNISGKYSGTVMKTELIGDSECYVLDLKPRPGGPSYSRIVLWVGRDDFVTRKIDFYEKDSPAPFKRLLMEDIRQVGNRKVAFKMTMRNLIENTETVNIIIKIQFDTSIPDSMFKPANLGR